MYTKCTVHLIYNKFKKYIAMKEKVLITGANSFIAKHLVTILDKAYDLNFLTRSPKEKNEFHWNLETMTLDEKALDGVNYIIHLAGSKLNDGTPLTAERQKTVRDSRIGATELLLQKLKQRNQHLKAFISASALGYYGFNDNVLEITEDGNRGFGFAADLSADWEKAADLFETENVADRVVKLRVSLVLGNEGGVFKDFKALLNQQPNVFEVANGNSYFPWVHVEDMAAMFAFGVTNETLNGVFNTTAPFPTTKEVIFRGMFALKNQEEKLLNEMNTTFNGQHLSSKKIEKEGFVFKFPKINEALKNLM